MFSLTFQATIYNLFADPFCFLSKGAKILLCGNQISKYMFLEIDFQIDETGPNFLFQPHPLCLHPHRTTNSIHPIWSTPSHPRSLQTTVMTLDTARRRTPTLPLDRTLPCLIGYLNITWRKVRTQRTVVQRCKNRGRTTHRYV